jgi:diketogulonate reductase-like aldo/keto reductase
LQAIGKKYQKSVPAVILNWLLWRRINIIPKSDEIKEIEENFHCDEFVMSAEDYEEISKLNKNIRSIDALNKNNYSGGLPVFD